MIRETISLARLRAMPREDAAAHWLVRRSQDFHPAEEQAFEAWLDEDPDNRAAWEDSRASWCAFDDSGDDELLQALRERALELGPEPRASDHRGAAAAAAAALLVTVAAGAFWLQGRPVETKAPLVASRDGNLLDRLGGEDYATARGAQRTVKLPDGSRVTLDTASAVDVAFREGQRSITLLRGRASFEVSHDAARPFAVRAGGREVVAIGTRFDVRLDPGIVRVTLIQGRVSVRSAGAGTPPVILGPGDELVDRNGRTRLSHVDVGDALDWQRGLLTFHEDTLATAAAELNRYSATRLVVRDDRIARLRVSGSFRTGDPGRFARTVAQIHPVRAVKSGDGSVELVGVR